MNMDWDTVSQIASTVGVIVTATSVVIAAASLFMGVRRYQNSQENAYIATLRKAVFDSRDSLMKASEMIAAYDFAYEMASSIANSRPMKLSIREMYEAYFHPLTDENIEKDGPPLRQELSSYIDKEWQCRTHPHATGGMDLTPDFLPFLGRETG
jgi:hypothetical protein